jgi:hypothetical protein
VFTGSPGIHLTLTGKSSMRRPLPVAGGWKRHALR